jgi:Pyruvate/2-oxoacid:ferredoxin oxidoreductase delta subunit
VSVGMPRGFNADADIAAARGRHVREVSRILEGLADKGLRTCGDFGETRFYGSPPLVPGIFEFQFMRGTWTDRDRRLARLIHDFKAACDAAYPPPPSTFHDARVITVDRAVTPPALVHTYDQVAHQIAISDPIAVSTCFCRYEAKLIDAKDDCGMPDEGCMMFGTAAQFVIGRKIGRAVSSEEAFAILQKVEDAALVHAGVNRQDMDFLCDCCRCHCSIILKTALASPNPSLMLTSGYQPALDVDLSSSCGLCVDRCPTEALSQDGADFPAVDLSRCIGCGVCASGCPTEAIRLKTRPGVAPPPENQKALKAMLSKVTACEAGAPMKDAAGME